MPNESIYSNRLPGFPKEGVGGKSYRTDIQYVGIATDLRRESPVIGQVWGAHRGLVTDVQLDPIENTTWGLLTVACEATFQPGEASGTLHETTYEIDWVDVPRPMHEHKQFSIDGSGTYKLTSKDIAEIGRWEKEENISRKSTYQYTLSPTEDSEGGPTGTLSTNAKMFARGIELRIEQWVDKVPVARRSDTYVGGPPPAGSAGKKGTPTVPNLPVGYEWIRSADRGVRAGGQNRWSRDTEWLGSKKVLVDVDEIFWSAPA